MKIALIGNTCNNNFAMLRYFRDLGCQADLYLYSDEGLLDSNPIHNPEWDTWQIKKWEGFIFRLPIKNGLSSVIGEPDKLVLPPNLKAIKNIFSKYEFCIGSGITPSIFWRFGRSLDIFYPYSTGIEWVNESENLLKLQKYNLEWPFRYFVYKTQIQGIKKAKKVVISSQGVTADILNNYKIKYQNLHIPQYYNREELPFEPTSKELIEIINKTKHSHFNIFSFMRHLWVFRPDKYSIRNWESLNKRNNWLINGFKEFLNNYPDNKAYLFLSKWGPDIIESEKLIKKLNLENNIIWLPLLARKDVGYLLSRVADLGVGEFVCSPGEPWGSTGWECLANGTPFLESVNYSQEEFYTKMGYELPPFMLNVQKEEDVLKHIMNCYANKSEYKQKAIENKNWFNDNNGIKLAKRWLELLA
jgi:hypothetical protein